MEEFSRSFTPDPLRSPDVPPPPNAPAAAPAVVASADSPAVRPNDPAQPVCPGGCPSESPREREQQRSSKKKRRDKEKARPVVVIKIGSSSLMNDALSGAAPTLSANARELASCVQQLREHALVVLVSSGAVAHGTLALRRQGFNSVRALPAGSLNAPAAAEQAVNHARGEVSATKPALAAIGQSAVMAGWAAAFAPHGVQVAQILLTRDNFGQQARYEHTRATLLELLRLGIVPIINENDVVAINESRIGDNDTLSALVASLLRADWLFLLTDVDALYTRNPRTYADAQPIRVVSDLDALQADTQTAGSAWGTGGMASKLSAVRLAVAAGVHTVIAHSAAPQKVAEVVLRGELVGTRFVPCTGPRRLHGERRMIAHGLRVAGTLRLDEGAASAVRSHTNLFSCGVRGVEGDFAADALVRLVDPRGLEVGRGLCALSAAALRDIVAKTASGVTATPMAGELKKEQDDACTALVVGKKRAGEQVVPRRHLCVAASCTFYN